METQAGKSPSNSNQPRSRFLKSLQGKWIYLVYLVLFLVVSALISVFRGADHEVSQSIALLPLVQSSHSTDHELATKPRPKVVYFWATWCTVCTVSLPVLRTNLSLMGSGIDFVSVEEGEMSINELKNFLHSKEIDFPVYKGNPSFLRDWKIQAYPTFVFLDSQDNVRFVDTGIISPISFYLRLWFLKFV